VLLVVASVQDAITTSTKPFGESVARCRIPLDDVGAAAELGAQEGIGGFEKNCKSLLLAIK
jgi:hypothetical protein